MAGSVLEEKKKKGTYSGKKIPKVICEFVFFNIREYFQDFKT